MPKVLVVDDDERVREQLYDALTSKGHTVVTAGSGEQALELLKAQRPQLVVLDLGLPKLPGLEAARRIREFDESVPIVFCRGAKDVEPSSDDLKALRITQVFSKEAWDLPRILSQLDVAAKSAPAPSATGAGGLAGTLLVIDDDPQVQSLLKLFFEKKGLRVVTAGSGEEGLKALSRSPVLIMLDVNMPGMDGVLTLKKLKAAAPKIPVVMMSGGGEEGMARAALTAGAYDYISKPFNLEYLETVVLTKVLVGMEG